MRGDRGGDVGEGRTLANGAWSDRGTEGEDRNLLAGVVGAAPGRIATVIGHDDDEIVAAQRRSKLRDAGIECFERRGVAGNIAAMAVERVEVDVVREQQAAVRQRLQTFHGPLE